MGIWNIKLFSDSKRFLDIYRKKDDKLLLDTEVYLGYNMVLG